MTLDFEGMRMGASTYSWQFTQEEMRSVEHVFDGAFEFGPDGMEVLHGHTIATKCKSLTMGLKMYSLEMRQNSKPLKERIDYTQRCFDVAYKLGAPAMVINSGGWGTVDFGGELVRAA